MGPRFVYLENVPGLAMAHGGLDAVLGSLAELGLDAEWDVFSAGACGAGHRRARIFILGWSAEDVADGRRRKPELSAGRGPRSGEAASSRASSQPHGRGQRVADSDGGRFAWPPGPEDRDGWRDYIAAGGPAPSLPGIRRGIDGVPEELEYAKDRLRALGNAVIPIASAYAVAKLVERLRQ